MTIVKSTTTLDLREIMTLGGSQQSTKLQSTK